MLKCCISCLGGGQNRDDGFAFSELEEFDRDLGDLRDISSSPENGDSRPAAPANNYAYNFRPLPIPYNPPQPGFNPHPALVKAKDAADRLNQAYKDVTDRHQEIRTELLKFRELCGQSDKANMVACFLAIERKAGRGCYVSIGYDKMTQEPTELVCNSEAIAEAVEAFNEMLSLCHKFLTEQKTKLADIYREVEALKKLSVTMHIREIWTKFEAEAPKNIRTYANEVQSLFLDIHKAEQQICGRDIYQDNGSSAIEPRHESEL